MPSITLIRNGTETESERERKRKSGKSDPLFPGQWFWVSWLIPIKFDLDYIKKLEIAPLNHCVNGTVAVETPPTIKQILPQACYKTQER